MAHVRVMIVCSKVINSHKGGSAVYPVKRLEPDELVGCGALAVVTTVVVFALAYMWRLERHESDKYRVERDELFLTMTRQT